MLYILTCSDSRKHPHVYVGYSDRPIESVLPDFIRCAPGKIERVYELAEGGPGARDRVRAALWYAQLGEGWFEGSRYGPKKLLRAIRQGTFDPFPWADAQIRRTWDDSRIARPPREILSDATCARIGVKRATPQTDSELLTTEQRRERRDRRAAAVRHATRKLTPDTIVGECIRCEDPLPVIAVGANAGCPPAGYCCDNCGRVEPA